MVSGEALVRQHVSNLSSVYRGVVKDIHWPVFVHCFLLVMWSSNNIACCSLVTVISYTCSTFLQLSYDDGYCNLYPTDLTAVPTDYPLILYIIERNSKQSVAYRFFVSLYTIKVFSMRLLQ